MSSINGTYADSNADARLVVTDGNDANGSFSGELTQAWALFSTDHNYARLRASGARSNFSGDVVGLSGEFLKQ